MSGKFELAPGVDIDWTGGLSEPEVLKNFEEQGGQPCWRPHIPGDVQRLLYEMGQQVLAADGAVIPPNEIPAAGYPLFEITLPTLDELESSIK